MSKFIVSGMMTVSCWTTVEAETEEDAIAIATEREPGSLSHNAIGPDSDECWHFENDGLPVDVKIESAS